MGTPYSTIDFTGPAAASEWFTVAHRSLTGRTLAGEDVDDPAQVWRDLAQTRAESPDQARVRIGIAAALRNLSNGIDPPASGRFNPHYFDDISCIYGFAAGTTGQPDAVRVTAETTHALDGVWCAEATAAMFAELRSSGNPGKAVSSGRGALPSDSWSAAVYDESLTLTREADSLLDYTSKAQDRLVDQIYAYPGNGPETLALLAGILTLADNAQELLLAASVCVRSADTLLPLAGAAAASLHGSSWLPARYRVGTGMALQGVNVAGLAGQDVPMLAGVAS